MKFFQKYLGVLRSFKIVYVINNILNYKKLSHNKILYKKYSIDKSIYSSICHRDIQEKPSTTNWLDKPNALQALDKNEKLKAFSFDIQEKIKSWPENGYLVLEKFFDEEQVKNMNEEVKELINKNEVDFRYNNRKIMFAFRKSNIIKDIALDSKLIKILNFILDRKVVLFQTINFIKGSEQKAHSDTVHMATHPLGNLIAVWIALEDTNEENGPLFYYPGSHKLPYVMNENFNTGHTRFTIGNNAYKNYEAKIEAIIKENNLKKVDFYAKKGDVFIWHANLIHGGNPMIDKNATRKSMVIHYFCKDVICYHEITERPALFDSNPQSAVQMYDED